MRVQLLSMCAVLSVIVAVTGSGRATSRRKSSRSAKTEYRTTNDVRPAFRTTTQNVTAGPGDRAVLKCRVDNLGTKTVTWRRHDDVHPLTIGLYAFVADSRIGVDYNQRTNEWSLIIQDVRPTDDGIYHCQISTKDADLDSSYEVRLNVKAFNYADRQSGAATGVHVTGTGYVDRGNAIQLVCNATGRPDPPHNVDWYKDGEKINSDADSGIIITKKIEARMLISMLHIRSSKMTDAGVYVCRSSNRDAGMINVIILNVSSPVEKRGTSVERTGMPGPAEKQQLSNDGLRVAPCRLSSIACPLVATYCLATVFGRRLVHSSLAAATARWLLG